ncbi:MAG: hypothetical protein ACLUJN_16740 [Blautia sp.]
MKAVKGYTKNDYIAICKEEEGGEVFNFKSMCEAVEYIAKFLPGSSKKKRLQELSMILIVTGFSLKMKVLFLDTTEKDMMKQL